MTTPLDKPPLDRFLYRLLAAIGCGIAILTAGFDVNIAFQRIPNLRRVVDNLHWNDIGRGGVWLFACPWLPLSMATLALLVSLTAFARPRRGVLATAFLVNFAAIGLTLAAEIAASRVWTRVLSKLLT